MKRRLLSILLAAVMLLSAVPLGVVETAWAADNSGSCGENVTWSLSDDGTLTISGTGPVADYGTASNLPWYSFLEKIKAVVIEDGVTTIGDIAFEKYDILSSVTIPSSVKDIKYWVFENCDALTDIYYDGWGMDWLAISDLGIPVSIPKNAVVHFKDNLYGKGACGENVNWVMTADGTLTISGTGPMADYEDSHSPWFSCRDHVKSVVIESGVTSIGSYAFSMYESLTSVTIGEGVMTIGDSAFFSCAALVSVTIPSSMKTIGPTAFSFCDALTDIYYDGWGMDWAAIDGFQRIPSSAVVHFKDDLYGKGECGVNVNWVMTGDGTLTISGTGRISNYGEFQNPAPWASCSAYVKSIVIESGVTAIGSCAFLYCTGLTSVTIPNTVTNIAGSAFSRCTSLTSINIPNSVTEIGEYAFSGCTGLTSVTIPDSVKSLGDGAFGDCSSLTSVTIPNSISRIENSTFSGCTSLTSVTIPNHVTCIGSWAFRFCTSLTSVIIPGSITEMGTGVFKGCTGLTSVTILNGVTQIMGSAFANCTALTSVTIPNSVTQIAGNAFEGCTALTDIKLPSGLEFIDFNTFSNCVRLASVTIPKSVTRINNNAFYYCESLTDVYYTGTEADWAKIVIAEGNEDLTNAKLHAATIFTPANVELVGATPAAGSIVVTWQAAENADTYTIYRKTQNTNWTVLVSGVSGTSYTDKSVTAGESYTYTVRGVAADGRTMSKGYDAKGVTAKVPAAVLASGSCGESVTWSLSSDGTLTLSGKGEMANYKSSDTAPYYNAPWGSDALRLKIKRLVVNEGITSIGDFAFYHCSNLTSVSLPNSLERIGNAVFFECSSLTSLVIPDNVTYIDSDLCTFCSSLETVKLPKWLMSCGGALFASCTSLTSVVLPENFNGITWRMFYDCSSLTTISIPVSVDFIDEEAFSGCNALSTVNYSGSQSDWKNITIASGNQPLTTAAMKYAPSVAGPTVTGRVDQYGELTLCWTAVENTKEYQLWYKDTASEYPYYRLMAVMSGDVLSRDGYFFQTEGHTYSYKVRAQLADGSYSRFSNAYTFTYEPKAAVPSNVELVGATPAANSITVTWQAAEGASTYTIYRKPAGTNNWAIIARNVSGTSYTDKSVTAGESYTYTVRGMAADGKTMSKGYDAKGVTAKVPAAVTAPANVTMKNAAVSGSSIVVTWDAAEGASTYVIYRKPAGTNSWAIIAKNVSGTSYTDTGVTAGESYTYTVRGVAADGKTMSKGYDTKGVTAKAPAASGVPANVTMKNAAISGSSIVVTWQAAEGASTYVIYRKPAGTNNWAIIARNVSGTSYTDKSVTAGESYTYTVRGVAADGKTMSKGYDTKGVTAKVPAASGVPANVTMKNAAVSGSSIVVTWQAAENASTYTVYRKPAGTNSWAIITKNVSGTSYTDKSVTAGESYTYTVRGVAADGRTMSKGYDTKGVTAKAPAASGVPANVTLTAAKADSAGILVTWEAAANAQTYTVYRKLTGTNSWAIVARSVAGTAWKDIHADKGISYTYTVRGVAADGRTMSKGYDTKGVTDQVTKAITTPANVTMTAASSSGTGIAVTWEYALDAKTYVVYRKPTGTNNWAIIARNVSGTSYTDKSVTAGESYTYTVRGVAADGKTMSKGYDTKGVTAKAFAVAASSVTG